MALKSRIFVPLAKAGFNLRFTVARLTRVRPVGRLVEKLFFEEDEMMYLPRDDVASKALGRNVTVDVGRSYEMESTVLPSQILEHFIRRSKHHFIMYSCLCRSANHCRDYPVDYGCLFLGRGVLRIDNRYGRPVTMEEALEHVRRCREAGLVHLIGRNKIDAVVFDTGRKEGLMSICSCCPCCCLWRMLPDLNAEIGGGVARMPEVRVTVTDGCTGCGTCVEEGTCFVGALAMRKGRAHIDQDRCSGCGRWVEACPQGAVELRIEERDFYGKSVKRVEKLVDIQSERSFTLQTPTMWLQKKL